jgi:uncharacterized protein involved in exopolysaccharide biosynthesis
MQEQPPRQEKGPVCDEMSLKDVVFFLLRHKVLIIVGTALFATGAVSIALTLPNYYQSTAKLVTRTSDPSNGGLAQMAALAGLSVGSGKSHMDPSKYFADVIRDRSFVLKILSKHWFVEGYADSVLLDQVWGMEKDSSSENRRYAYETQMVNRLRGGEFITLTTDRKTEVVTLTTRFMTPALTLQINQHVLSLLAEYMRESFRSQAQEKRKFIEERIAEVAVDLENSENRLASFKERNLATTAPKVFLEEQRLQRKLALNQELYIQLKKQFEIARIEEKNDQPLIELLQSPELPIVKAGPQRSRIVAITAIVGLLLSMTFAFARRWYTSNFRK